MRTLNRNKQTIYYANLNGQTKVYDADGFYTGETELAYTTPTEIRVNVSAARGSANIELFGTELNYTKTIVTEKDYGIDEHSVLWVGKDPENDPYNYIVVSVAKSINFIVYAIREVNVSENN